MAWAARLIYLGTARFFDSFPKRWLMRWQGRRFFRQKRLDQRRHAAAISQQRRYPDDWVFEFVEGDGQDFAAGVDYTECGLARYLAREVPQSPLRTCAGSTIPSSLRCI